LHGEGVPEHERNPLASAKVSEPVPGKDTLNGDDKIVSIRSNGSEKRVRTGLHVLMRENIAGLVEDADGHRPRVQVDPTIRLMLLGVESHEVSSFAE
jgi:hypothetical protein